MERYMSYEEAFNELVAAARERIGDLRNEGLFMSADRLEKAVKLVGRYRMENHV